MGEARTKYRVEATDPNAILDNPYEADYFEVHDGALVLYSAEFGSFIGWAAGQWKSITEDKGDQGRVW